MNFLIFAMFGLGLLMIGMILVVVSLAAPRDPVTRRLNDYVTAQTVSNSHEDISLAARRTEITGGFRSRILIPAFRGLGRVFGSLTPSKALKELDRQLTIADRPLGLGSREFYGIRLVFLILGLVLAYLILRRFGPSSIVLMGSSLIFLISAMLPKTWLKGRVRSRQNRIRKGLPDALDMLSVCAEAGLGFDQSLQRVSEEWKTPLGVEFGRVVREMELGLTRRSALRNLADRLDVQELSSFIAVILQSEQLGMSISDTLQAQAKQMREERRFKAQEQARKVPLKMLFPMVLFIMPAIFAVILGPTIPILINFFRTAGSTTLP